MSFSVFAATASVTLHFYFPIFPLYKIKAANVRMLQKARDTKRLLHLSKFCPNILSRRLFWRNCQHLLISSECFEKCWTDTDFLQQIIHTQCTYFFTYKPLFMDRIFTNRMNVAVKCHDFKINPTEPWIQ